jgi:hypothetical protein
LSFQFNHHFKFVFHTTWIDACHVCAALDGQTFTDQDLFQHTLWSPIWGDIWDLDNDLPLTHPNCKCRLEVIYESTLDELLLPSKTDIITRNNATQTVARDMRTGQFTKNVDVFQEFKIMSSNIKEMKAEIGAFERDLARAENRIENTKFQLMTYMQLLQKAGLPPDIERAINVLVRAKMTAEQAQRAIYLLMAASGPAGWAMALASLGITVISGAGTMSAAMEIGGT